MHFIQCVTCESLADSLHLVVLSFVFDLFVFLLCAFIDIASCSFHGKTKPLLAQYESPCVLPGPVTADERQASRDESFQEFP